MFSSNLICSSLLLCHLFLGQPCCLLLPSGLHCKTCFCRLPFGILQICPNRINCLYLISSTTVRVTSIIYLILLLVIVSILDLPGALLQPLHFATVAFPLPSTFFLQRSIILICRLLSALNPVGVLQYTFTLFYLNSSLIHILQIVTKTYRTV